MVDSNKEALQGSAVSESGKGIPTAQNDLDNATGAVSPKTKVEEVDESGSGAQSALKMDPSKDLKKTLIIFLQHFGIVINETDPYAILQIQSAVSELVHVLECIDLTEARKIIDEPKVLKLTQEKKLNDCTAKNFKSASSKTRKPQRADSQTNAMKLKEEIKDGNGNAKLSFTGDALHETGPAEVDPETGSSVDSEDINRENYKGKREVGEGVKKLGNEKNLKTWKQYTRNEWCMKMNAKRK